MAEGVEMGTEAAPGSEARFPPQRRPRRLWEVPVHGIDPVYLLAELEFREVSGEPLPTVRAGGERDHDDPVKMVGESIHLDG
jgi:hypothetical protein